MMPSDDGGIPTTDRAMPAMSDLVAFYQYVMQRCDEIDQWENRTHQEEELNHLGYRLTRCASEVPDDMRASAIAEAMTERIDGSDEATA